MKEYQSYTLKNGLRIVHKPLNSNVSYCGFIVNSGTRDENADEYGMAHFVEHMLFKGTQKRKSHHIINRMESVGGEINAYTNKEETVIYSVFLEEHYERAFELLTDLTFHSTFPAKEVEKEIEVILDEINSYEDNPSELIFDEFENIIFRDSQLGHNILGEEDTLINFTPEKGNNFVRKYYTPQNIVFFSLGKTDIKKIVRLAEKYLSERHTSIPENIRIKPSLTTATKNVLNKDTNQAHVMIGSKCYDLHDPNRRVLYLLNNILGGPGMNSRLNISLREKRGYVYNVESNMTNYSDTGIFSIYFGSDKKNADKCIELIHKELRKLQETKLTTLQLSSAKKQLIGQISISGDNHENLALALGKNYLHYNHFNSLEETIKKIEGINVNDILEIANNIFNTNKLSYLIYK
ncbi:MAG: pitrilysin family protein [Dysgonomonas sp.]|nr:pitrilysin family protein [Dysgonomonas sp.]